MTPTQSIRVHPERAIAPEECIARAAIRRDHAEEDRRGTEFCAYRVPSRSRQGASHLVVWDTKRGLAYCRCEAATYGRVCDHLRSVAWLRTYDLEYRNLIGLTVAELVERDRDCARQARGLVAPVWGWRARWAACGDLLCEMTREGVA